MKILWEKHIQTGIIYIIHKMSSDVPGLSEGDKLDDPDNDNLGPNR